MSYYAYLHARPDTVDAHGVFYVGKGKGNRAHDMSHRNRFHANVVAKYGVSTILVGKLGCSSEETAFELEVGLIKCLRRMNVKLSNLTNGGEGTSGLAQTPEHRQKLSKAHKGKTLSDVHRARLSESHKGLAPWNKGLPSHLKGVALSDAHKARLREAALNRKYKLSHSDDAKLAISASVSRSKWYTDGVQNKRIQPERISELEACGWKQGKAKTIERKVG